MTSNPRLQRTGLRPPLRRQLLGRGKIPLRIMMMLAPFMAIHLSCAAGPKVTVPVDQGGALSSTAAACEAKIVNLVFEESVCAQGIRPTIPSLDRVPDILCPPGSSTARFEGEVFVTGRIQEDGRVDSLRVAVSLSPLLDSQALASVSKWRFRPGRCGDSPLPVPFRVSIGFRSLKS
jgi:TonB family protein